MPRCRCFQLTDDAARAWAPALDLIGAAPTDQLFVAEVNDQGIAGLRINNPPTADMSLPTSADTKSGSALPFVSSAGVITGMAVSGVNIAEGTTVSKVTATSITLSDPVTGKVPSGSSITFTPTLSASYWVGNGTAGNAEIEAINALVWAPGSAASTGHLPAGGISGIRNPLPASGGIDAETTPRPSSRSPARSRSASSGRSPRPDYATLATAVPGVRRAAAELRFTGSLLVVDVAIQPQLGEDPATELLADVRRSLQAVRKIGQLVRVVAAALPAAGRGARRHAGPWNHPPPDRAPPRPAAIQRLAA